MEETRMTRMKLSFTEAIQSLKESMNSEFKDEREIAQILLNQHYGYKGDYKYEEIDKHKDRMSDKHMG